VDRKDALLSAFIENESQSLINVARVLLGAWLVLLALPFVVGLALLMRQNHALSEISDEMGAGRDEPLPDHFEVREKQQAPDDLVGRYEITLNERPVPVPEAVSNLMSSIILDLGEIPDDYLTPAGPGEYDLRQYREQKLDPDEVWQGAYHEEGAFLYKEWDFKRQHYRKNAQATQKLTYYHFTVSYRCCEQQFKGAHFSLFGNQAHGEHSY